MSTEASPIEPRLANLIRLAGSRILQIEAQRFFFLRHGETEGNRRRIIQPAEEPLNALGLEQAAIAAEVLRAHPVARIHASTMRRAWQTAEAVAAVTGHEIVPTPGLREKWFGDWVGRSSAELEWDTVPPNGESLGDFIERTCAAARATLQHAEGTLLVAHGGTLFVIASALGVEVTPEIRANATPLLFERDGGRWRAVVLAQLGAPTAEVPS
jgi:probable phosphoglycerate mutase